MQITEHQYFKLSVSNGKWIDISQDKPSNPTVCDELWEFLYDFCNVPYPKHKYI